MLLMVKDLLLLPEFREFQLAAGEKGLDNRVTGTGIFEWESPEDIARDFQPGEFVVTTLSQMKGDPAGAEGVLLKLLESGVSGIGLKTIYYRSFPEKIRKRADETGIPLFSFRETFFDDIIYAIKSRLVPSEDSENRGLPSGKLREEGPFVCVWSREGELDRGQILPADRIPQPSTRGTIGISDPFSDTENLATALQQGRIACISGLLSGQPIRFFRDSGGDRLLVPASREPWAWDFYQELKGRIEGEKGDDKGEWMTTLLTYGRFHGDIRQTGAHLFQHENTIRYRIRILRKRLGLAEDPDYYGVIYNFVRLHGIYELWPL